MRLRQQVMYSSVVRFLVASLAGIVFVAASANGQTPGGTVSKSPSRQLAQESLPNSTDFIVVYDDRAIQRDVKAMQSQMGLPSQHRRVLELKATRYAEKKKEVQALLGSQDASVLEEYSHLPMSFVRFHSKEALNRVISHPGVVKIFKDRAERLSLAQSLPLIGQPQIAAQGYLGAGTAVAVLDTGVDYTRAAFGSCTAPGVPSTCKVAYAKEFNAGIVTDAPLHGTNVAGIVAGVAPGTKIIDLKVFGSNVNNATKLLAALNWVIANKATYNIVATNLSLGSGRYRQPDADGLYAIPIAQLRAAGILTIAAAGNDGFTDSLESPAATPGAVSVGAVYDSVIPTTRWGEPLLCQDSSIASDKVTCFSNSATFLTLLAPGAMITAAGITEGGTSQAAPHVAGAVATLRASFPNETLDQTVARLTNGIAVTDNRNDITKPRLYLPAAFGVGTPCTYALSETSKSFGASSSTGAIAVTAASSCTWLAASASSSASWLTITSGNSGLGSGTVAYTVSANPNAVGRTGTMTVAGVPYTVTQSGSTGTTANILGNPGFEDGPVGWISQTANGMPLIYAYPSPAANNAYFAWLCGYDNCLDSLYQDVTIPASAQSAYVQFSYWIKTAETSSATAFDAMTVKIGSPTNAITYQTLTSFSNLNAASGWVLGPQLDVSAYKGQTIRILFSATTDSSYATSFYLDDVVLNVVGATPDTQSPTIPTGLAASTSSPTSVTLSWIASSDNVGVTSYRIYRDGILVATVGKVLSYADTGLVSGSVHSYTVSACDSSGNCSAGSLTATSAGQVDTQAPTVPTLTTVGSSSTTSISVSWSASTDNIGVTAYRVFRNGILGATLGNVTSYTDTGLTPATPYSYTVSACDAAGNCSAQSLAKSGTTAAPAPLSSLVTFGGSMSTKPSGNSVAIHIDKITNTSSGHSGSLRIEMWGLTSPYFGGSVTGYVAASIRTYLISGLSDYIGGNSTWSSIDLNLPYTQPPSAYKQTTLFLLEYSTSCSTVDHFCIIDYANLHDASAPSLPTGITGQAVSSSQINLQWTASTDNVGVANYKIYRNGSVVAVLGNVTSFSDFGLSGSTTYSYTVSACDLWQNCSAQSSPISVTTLAARDAQAPTVPTGLTATVVSSTHIQLGWNASIDNVGVTAYKIYSSGNLVGTLGNVTSSLRSNSPSSTYSYTVAACDAADNCSAQSLAAVATTPSINIDFVAGWNLVGNSVEAPLIIASAFSDASKVNSVWKWNAAKAKWAFYTPTQTDGGVAYAATKGYDALTTINGGDGFWVQAKAAFSVALPAGSVIQASSFRPAVASPSTAGGDHALPSGWSLVATGDSPTPTQFDTAIATVNSKLPKSASVYTNLYSLWSWDATKQSWYFWSPSLVNSGALSAYISGNNYLDFSALPGTPTGAFSPTMGFWVNMP